MNDGQRQASDIWASVNSAAAAAAKGTWEGIKPVKKVLWSDVLYSPKREAFLQDQDLVRVLYPEDAWGAGAADVLEAAVNDIAADLATLGDRVVCAVLEARGVR